MRYLTLIFIFGIYSFAANPTLASELSNLPVTVQMTLPTTSPIRSPSTLEELVLYDPSGPAKQRLILKETQPGTGIWKGESTVSFGSGGFNSLSVRIVSFMKNKGWHYRFTATASENIAQPLILELNRRKVPPAKKSILTDVKFDSTSHSVSMEIDKNSLFLRNISVADLPKPPLVRDLKPPAETIIRRKSPVIVRLVSPQQQVEPEIIVYDEFSKTRAYFHLKKTAPGVFEGLYRFRIGVPDLYLPRFRVVSFLKDKGWHYPYVSYYEKVFRSSNSIQS